MKKIILCIFALLLLTSCGAKKVFLEYGSPQYSGPKIKKTAYIEKFDDNRVDKTRLGVTKHGFGGEISSVQTEQDISLWISNALAIELLKAGLNVKKTDRYDDPANMGYDELWISGNVIKVFVEPVVGFFASDIICNIDVEITTIYKGEKYTKKFSETSSKKTLNPGIFYNMNDYKSLLETTVRTLVLKVTNEIAILAK